MAGDGFVWRELDWIRVKGRTQPVRIFEPMATADSVTADQHDWAVAYGEGLSRWRARDYTGAATCFERFAGRDPAAAVFQKRALELIDRPPGPDWEPVNTLEDK